ncbi:hypothetical protein MPTK1_3g13520 [Marchantia polymorpha subsp. ruderalis]|uniref:Uncharacterized protein n=2 Tax=Marchantia polymorpha TaxID=3197 RepID=A0AAF6B0F6_MARPO|nr:hypothetical protein MARPO_2347s0001 [Marchantia polymorpha]BBN05490.1 hypothetical protein Mp_3g13520 [Marchantia polymorpha subsp. ruderalis]|eukprot:PTQ26369.1 hypothetical protein MARPO_2347s0001 [Marchantia polymorpha]
MFLSSESENALLAEAVFHSNGLRNWRYCILNLCGDNLVLNGRAIVILLGQVFQMLFALSNYTL